MKGMLASAGIAMARGQNDIKRTNDLVVKFSDNTHLTTTEFGKYRSKNRKNSNILLGRRYLLYI